MLRTVVVILAALNLLYWVWSTGVLRSAGFGMAEESEPQRLARQLRPDALKVRPMTAADEEEDTAAMLAAAADADADADADAALAAQTPADNASAASELADAATTTAAAASGTPEATAEKTCLQVGVFNARQAEAVRTAAATLPKGSWRMDSAPLPGRWMVYIKLDNAAAVAAKRAEIRALGLDTARPDASFEPGLSLGRYSSQEGAQRALADARRKGVTAATVVQERGQGPGYVLRLPQADAALRQQVGTLRPVLDGRTLKPCE
jgi:hypothetical protein